MTSSVADSSVYTSMWSRKISYGLSESDSLCVWQSCFATAWLVKVKYTVSRTVGEEVVTFLFPDRSVKNICLKVRFVRHSFHTLASEVYTERGRGALLFFKLIYLKHRHNIFSGTPRISGLASVFHIVFSHKTLSILQHFLCTQATQTNRHT